MEDAANGAWFSIAQKLWLNTVPKKLDSEVLRTQIWDPLEKEGLTARSILELENLQILERYLWPTFSEDSSNQQVVLIAAFVNFKRQASLDPWLLFSDKQNEFTILFQRALSLCLDPSLAITSKLAVLNFVGAAFQSLEKEFVRKECAPLVSIGIWHNLHSEACRSKELQKSTLRQKAWRSSEKRFQTANDIGQNKIRFDRAWLYSMVLDFFHRVNTGTITSINEVHYCERFLELLTDLISQLPTRRYVIVLLKELNTIPVLKTSSLIRREEYPTFDDLFHLYEHFSRFEVDDNNHQAISELDKQYEELGELQRVAYHHFDDKLKVLALSNFASIASSADLASHLSPLSDEELKRLCDLLDFRTSYPANSGITIQRPFLLEVLFAAYCRSHSARDIVEDTSVVPTEQSLYDATLLRNETYDSSRPCALPKLNLQYLSLDDFMWRSFRLQQAEAFYEIRKDMESIVRRMKPQSSRDPKTTHFDGFSKMAMPIEKPAVIEVGQAKVGSQVPGFVRAEVILDVSRLTDRIVKEWDSLRPKDTIFLLSIKANEQGKPSMNGGTSRNQSLERNLAALRTAEVVQLLDDKGKPIREVQNGTEFPSRSKRRRLILDLDPLAYHYDQQQLSKGKADIWSSLNVIARRQGRENNFKPVLETIQKLVGNKAQLATWLQEVYLGYGDPKSASYPNLSENIERIDFLDTFLDWEHLRTSFAKQEIVNAEAFGRTEPPYVLEMSSESTQSLLENPKKRRRHQMEDNENKPRRLQVSTYTPPNTGPYPVDQLKKNTVRFTPKQVSAIMSGSQPGLTLIVGPPGTGKTDVATQIINLLYHNFPSEKVLLIAHSNQALNQLFQKIVALDIDPRHLLRLGHGEEELETEVSYSKYGRVESFLDNRQNFLAEVNRLAVSVGAAGAHGSTCETADYFNQVFVLPAWTRFWSVASSETATPQAIIGAFPFKKYFSTAPVPELLPESASVEELCETVRGCQAHLDKLFSELETIRPFEILRNPRDQANHLLVKEARIIAMTSTHAAIRRSEIADSGFHYDSLIMEEAAQITEVESFIPCTMQKSDPRTGELPLKRVVLVGDHLQNSPVVQNLALRQYANFEQSLFLRLVRLGVPMIALDQQGRCRPSIAELFSWRYENLGNLPHLTSLSEYQQANAGFRHEFQFIDVPDYQDQGEREPTPHFIQNLGEAEYAVALYQYMRLLGYPARSISILATYAGQKALIRDVLEHRCKGNRLFGMPRIVTTVDKYQGEQNDYVILSLVRTKSVGYLRDVRRLTVALSRARLGLYILGRKDLFESCFEMKTAMERLAGRGRPEGKLELVTGEMYRTTRLVDAEAASVPMDGVEHLGQYVYEMTQAKIKSLGGTANIIDADADGADEGLQEDADPEDADLEQDPLHESVV